MHIGRILYPVTTLGIGKRIAIWTTGCSKRCQNCITPEFWPSQPEKDMPVPQLLSYITKIISNNDVDGITISGGDPLEQADELLSLITEASRYCSDILIYTGFTISEIKNLLSDEQFTTLVNNTAVLIDGRYMDEYNDNVVPLRGSANQEIHYFNKNIQPKYEEYIRQTGRQVQNVLYENKIISIGIHNKEG